MPRLTPLPGELVGRAFTIEEAHALGVTPDRTRRSDLAAPFRGVRVPSDSLAAIAADEAAALPWSRMDRVAIARARAASLLLAPGAVVSHTTAARVHGFPLSSRLARDIRVHVSVAVRTARPEIRGVVSHFAPRDVRHAVLKDGLTVTDPVRTWVALASIAGVDELIALGDHLVRRRHPDADIDQLRRAVDAAAGRHGVNRLRAALPLIRARTDSVRETEVRLILLDSGLPEPVVNHPIRDRDRRFIRHGDMAYPEHRVLVEYDGEQHRLDDEQYRLDKLQLERLVAAGWVVIHVVKQDLRHPASIALRVRTALRSRES